MVQTDLGRANFGRALWMSLIATASFMSAQPAFATDPKPPLDTKAGVDAWARGDYPAAVRAWQAPAEKGDPDAQFNLGQAYRTGKGVKQDLRKAEELFGRAADKGHLQASDLYGLLMFQRGERAKALPYVRAAADRGEAPAQYLLGVAHFNGDNVPKDWVRAYALTSLAQQSGLDLAKSALAQMDRYIPLEQRQQGVALARELASQAEATRARQFAAADLGTTVPVVAGSTAPAITATPRARTSATAADAAAVARIAADNSPRNAGADYARPQTPASARPTVVAATPTPSAPVAAPRAAPPTIAAAPSPRPALPTSAPANIGPWRVQLGAFSVAANANALWSRVKSRPELTGRARQSTSAAGLTKLFAGGFASRDEAQGACSRLAAGGFPCLVVRN